MSDLKSKLPDLKELGEISGKLFKDIKASVEEIVKSYKQKRAKTAPTAPNKAVKKTTSVTVEVSAKASKEKKPAAKIKADRSSDTTKDS